MIHGWAKKSQGFSLIEMVVISSIIAIVALVIGINWPSKAIDVSLYTDRLVADLRYAQHLAQTTNQRLQVNLASGSYSLTQTDGSTAVNFASGNTNSVSLPSGMTLSTSGLANPYVVFDALGRPYSTNASPGTLLSSSATITLTQGGHSSSVTIQPNSGKIQ